jgi:hypothetical protein
VPVVRQSLLPLLLASWVTACGDPVRTQAIAALGPEAENVSRGPLHRPGQPCLVCHDSGEASMFTVAGTVYARAATPAPLNGVTVQLIDSLGHQFNATSNCAGNFFVRPSEFVVSYPLWVTMAVGTESIDMESPVYRDGSCASCHTDPKGPASAGHVYLLLDEKADLSASHYCR